MFLSSMEMISHVTRCENIVFTNYDTVVGRLVIICAIYNQQNDKQNQKQGKQDRAKHDQSLLRFFSQH